MAVSLHMSEMDSDVKGQRNKDRVTLNIGGVRYETYKSTLKNFPDTRLAWITGRDSLEEYDPEKNEYFFDRHPGVFQQIINFYRTGKLHCPSDVCGPLFEEELNYWGIDEKQMESCCWSTYTLHREAQENLKVFNGSDFENDSDDDENNSEPEEQSHEHRGSITPAWQRWKSKIWSVFDDHTSSKVAKVYVWVSLAFVVISVMSLCAYTDPAVQASSVGDIMIKIIDYICGIWFTAEFILRCLSCPSIAEFSKQFLNWIDLLAIVPFYINIIATNRSNIVSEILVLVRMFRLFRFFKMSLGLQILKHTLVASSKEMFLLFLLIMIPVLIFAGILHLCEKAVEGTKFKSIPEALWWAIITLTTVGYGDMTPTTTQGKIFGSICAGVSMLISALPISIIGANFSLYYRHAQAKLKLPKKPRKVLIGAANALVRGGLGDEPENSDQNSSQDLTTEVYLGPKRPRRERMSLFSNSIASQRHSCHMRSLGTDNLPGETTNDDRNCNLSNSDHHKSSLLSTSTKSTTPGSPPPRSISFPANLRGLDKDRSIVFEPGGENGIENTGFNQDSDATAKQCNGHTHRSFSAGNRYKRNGVVHPFNAPRLTITTESTIETERTAVALSENNNSSEHKLSVPSNDKDEKIDTKINSSNTSLIVGDA